MDKELIEDKLHQIIDQFSERKFTSTKFCSIPLNKIHSFYDEMVERVRYYLLMII